MPDKEYYQKYKEQSSEYNKKYRQEHKEEIKKYNRDYREEHKDETKKYSEEYCKKYPEIILKTRKKFHKLHPEKCGEYRNAHKEERQMWRIRRRCRFRNAGELTVRTIQLVYEDNIKKYGTLTCEYCKKPIEFGEDTLDHKTPLSRGGTNDYENLCIACRSCNSRKSAKTPEEFREYVRRTNFLFTK